MPSRMIGRMACPECGFESAHVKQSEKCHYRYCPECGSQHHAKTARQVTDLLAKTRLIDPPTGTDPKPTDAGTDSTTSTEPKTTTSSDSSNEPKPKRRGLFA